MRIAARQQRDMKLSVLIAGAGRLIAHDGILLI